MFIIAAIVKFGQPDMQDISFPTLKYLYIV